MHGHVFLFVAALIFPALSAPLATNEIFQEDAFGARRRDGHPIAELNRDILERRTIIKTSDPFVEALTIRINDVEEDAHTKQANAKGDSLDDALKERGVRGGDNDKRGVRGGGNNKRGVRGGDNDKRGVRGGGNNKRGVRGGDNDKRGVRGGDNDKRGVRGGGNNKRGVRGGDNDKRGVRGGGNNKRGVPGSEHSVRSLYDRSLRPIVERALGYL